MSARAQRPLPGSFRYEQTDVPVGMDGTIYLLHLAPGLLVIGNRVARHYIGWNRGDLDARVRLHQRGDGSPFSAAAGETNRGGPLLLTGAPS